MPVSSCVKGAHGYSRKSQRIEDRDGDAAKLAHVNLTNKHTHTGHPAPIGSSPSAWKVTCPSPFSPLSFPHTCHADRSSRTLSLSDSVVSGLSYVVHPADIGRSPVRDEFQVARPRVDGGGAAMLRQQAHSRLWSSAATQNGPKSMTAGTRIAIAGGYLHLVHARVQVLVVVELVRLCDCP